MAEINKRNTWSPNLDDDEIIAGAREQLFGMENIGFCIECGYQSDECEPDAREYTCDGCGDNKVYGACELLNYM